MKPSKEAATIYRKAAQWAERELDANNRSAYPPFYIGNTLTDHDRAYDDPLYDRYFEVFDGDLFSDDGVIALCFLAAMAERP